MGLEPAGEEYVEANLFDLIEAFRQLVTRFEDKGGLEIVVETKTIQQRISEIIRLLRAQGQAGFVEVCRVDRSKPELVLTFLSILELARVGWLRIYQHQATRVITLFFVEKSDNREDEVRIPREGTAEEDTTG
jgi:segregation and condensation protein A